MINKKTNNPKSATTLPFPMGRVSAVGWVKPNRKPAFTLAEVKGMFPPQGGGLGRGGDLNSSEQCVSPSLEFVGSPQLTNKFFSLPRRDRHVAFTLAEVLITLGVIGVVSALTLSALINKINEIHFKKKFKREYSLLYNATLRIINENGGNLSTAGINVSETTLLNVYKPYLRIVYLCPTTTKLQTKCWHEDGDWKYLNGNIPNKNIDKTTNGGFILNDGTMIKVRTLGSNCKVHGNENDTVCGHIFIDLNGQRKPNIVGKDIYGFILYNTGLKIYTDGTGCGKTSTGYDCALDY